MQRRFHLGLAGFQFSQFFRRQFTHLRVIQHCPGGVDIVQHLAIGAYFLDQWPQIRIFLAELGDITCALGHLRLDELETLRNLLKAV